MLVVYLYMLLQVYNNLIIEQVLHVYIMDTCSIH